MRFHEPDGDTQIGAQKTAVDLDRDGTTQCTQIFMVLIPPGKMIGNEALKDPVTADKLAEFLSLVRPVQTCGDKNGDVVRLDIRPSAVLPEERVKLPRWGRDG